MIHNVDPRFSQWDVGRSVSISDSEATHIHFANQGDSKAVIMEITEGSAKVPDYLLQTGKNVIAYAVLNGVTLESKSFPVRKRERPESYVYEDDQRNYIYALVTSAERAVTNANVATGNANNAAERASLAATNANAAVNSANEASNLANLAAQKANEAATKAANTAKSLMVIGGAKGTAIALDNAIDQTLVGLRVFGKTTQDGTPTPDAPVELVSAGGRGSISAIVAGKNLLPNEVSSQTINGLTVAVNSDKSITFNGIAEEQTTLLVKAGRGWINGGNYVGTGCPGGGDASKYYIRFGDSIKSYDDYGTGVAVSFAEDSHCYAQITIMSGVTAHNLTFHPMLRHTQILDSTYEPYKAQAMTIATPNGLPGIPVTSDGNYTDANGQQWVCDEIDFARGVYVQRIGRVTLTGEESGWIYFNSSALVNQFYIPISVRHISNDIGAMCAYYRPYYLDERDGNFGIIYTRSDGLAFNTNECTSVDDWKGLLAERPITVLYILATTIETPLSEEELAAYAALYTYKNHTTVSNDAGAWMDLEYVMDAKKYIDGLVTGMIHPATVE